MRRDVAITVGSCVLAVSVVIALFVYSVVRETPLSDAQMRDYGAFVLPKPRELAPVQLLDQAGRPFASSTDLSGHWTLMYFGYTSCPDICPVTLAVLSEARRKITELAPQATFDVVMVSVDPERDTPAKLAEYVPYFNPTFVGVTGDHTALAQLATSVNVAFGKVPGPTPDGYLVDHSGNIVLINPRGHYHGFIKMPHDAARIAAVVRSLQLGW